MLIGLVLVAVAVPTGWALLSGDGDGDGNGNGSELPSAPTVDPRAMLPAESFRVVYRLDDTAGAEPQTQTDVLAVRRPFEARLEHRQGPPPGGEVVSSTVINRRFQFYTSRGEERFATGRIPGSLPQVFSVEALEAAVAAGVAERLEGKTVGGEPCVRYRYRRAGGEPLTRATDQERVEVCITGDGILLREVVVIEGRQVRVSEAVEVDRSPAFGAETFLTERNPSEEPGARLLETEQVVAEGSSDTSRVALAVPQGFEVARQVTVQRQLGPGSPPVALLVQAATRGVELVVTEELLTPSANAPWSGEEGAPVDLGEGRTGRVVYYGSSAEVRVTAGGRYVTVSSPRPELALAVARTVTPK